MKPILPGGRGPAVEDVQRRLHALGYDLGPTGIDGVFLGMTHDAIVAFQRENELSEDGIVGEETWSALVDATFTLGDRVLYLRLPHFHGRDVRALQEALGALGFMAVEPDGIFGPNTERAVREFQRNSGQPVDGIVGTETVRLVERLRHVWEGRSASLHPRSGSARPDPIAVLTRTSVAVAGDDVTARDIANRIVNVALASEPTARIALLEDVDGAEVTIRVVTEGEDASGVPVVVAGGDDVDSLAGRIITALAAVDPGQRRIAIDVEVTDGSDQALQRTAVRMFDAICRALARQA